MPWVAATLFSCLLLAVAGWRCRATAKNLAVARADGAAMQRTAHLAALELRDAALRLHALPNHATGSSAAPTAETLAALAERCRQLGDDLAAIGPRRRATLRPEPLDLEIFARESAAALAAIVAPGRRHVRIDAAGGGLGVLADRRAVREVLRRVLGEAALHTREADWIAVTITPDPGGGARLTVSDEGAGLPTPAPSAPGQPDSRGVGASLALARTLMEAHGGTLDVEAALGAGTRVSLWFPRMPDGNRDGNPDRNPDPACRLSSS